MFVRLGWKKLVSEKHSSLLRKYLTYGRKKFYNIGPRMYDLLWQTLAVLTNIGLGWKGWPGTNTLAYLTLREVVRKYFYSIDP
jgi:hypothetical protein